MLFLIPVLLSGPAFIPKKRSMQNGPGLGNLTYSASELFKPIAVLSAQNGAPLGHGHAMMFKGYLALILAHDSGERGGGFAFMDVSDPRNPQAVLTKVDAETEKIREGHGYGFFRIGERDYVALQTIEGIQIWDWTDVQSPTLAANLVLPGVQESDYTTGAWWVAVQAPYLYVAGSSNGFYIVDASVPSAPVLIRQVPITQTGGFRIGPIFAVGNLLVVSSMDALGLATLDISDPTTPVLLDTDVGTIMYSGMVNGNYFISVAVDQKVHIWDISNPGDIKKLGSSPTLSGIGGYLNVQDHFVHAGMSEDYHKLDITDPANIIPLGNGNANIPDSDHDFASALGNLVLVGNDHGTGSGLIVHQTDPDRTPPVVTRVMPADNALNQALTARIGITFSDGIEYASINEQTFIVRPLGGQPLEGTYSYQFGIVNFTPRFPLDPDKVYEIFLPAGGLRDYAGNPLASDFLSKFSTGSSLHLLGCGLKGESFVELGFNSRFEVRAYNTLGTPTFLWNFGDGTSYGPTSDTFANHIYQNIGTYTVLVVINDGVSQSTCNIRHTVHERIDSALPAQATTILLDKDGHHVWNVNPDNNTVTKTNIQSLSYLKEVSTGKHPASLAQDGDGKIWILNRDDATIQIYDDNTGNMETIALPHGSMPVALVIRPDKQKAYVSLYATGKLAKIDVSSRTVEDEIAIGSFPKGLAVSRDNQLLFVTKFITNFRDSGEVALLDAETLTPLKTVKLAPDQSVDSEISGKGVVNYLNSVTLSPDGRLALVPAKKDNTFRGLLRDGEPLNFENTVRPMVALINLQSREEDYNARIDINNGDLPSFAAFSRFANLIFVSMQGNDRVDVFDAYTSALITSVEGVGAAPQGLVLSPTGDTLFVHGFLSRTISAYDISRIVNQVSAEITKIGDVVTVKNETMDPIVLKGKKIFYNANDNRMNKDKYLSCATCHLDGDHDGRVWDLTQLGEGLRNTIPLNGRAGMKHGPVHWTGNFDEIQDFEGQIRDLAGGRGFMRDVDFHVGSRSQPMGDTKAGFSDDLDALAAYIASLDNFGISPYRNADGSLTEEGKRGKQVFARLQCGLCHGGRDFTDSETGLLHDVGTIKPTSGTRLGRPLLGLDVPTLKGLWLGAPYLHDGSKLTLWEALNARDNTLRHSDLSNLTGQEASDLIAYLLQLDDQENGTAPFMQLMLAEPQNHALIYVNKSVPLKVKTNLQDITEVRYYVNGVEVASASNVEEPISYTFNTTGVFHLQAKVWHTNGMHASVTRETSITIVGVDCDLGLSVAPNPVADEVRISLQGINASQVRLFDVAGKLWLQHTMRNTSETLNLKNMPRGIYFLEVQKGDCRRVKRILRFTSD
ncbi:MAG: hypothetical protein KatS3mg031_1953 [Chitinophagales bacterium]|nr:MAG: hypothetical protein KatS3mg031_1953 [Chitinophagales bacterium]